MRSQAKLQNLFRRIAEGSRLYDHEVEFTVSLTCALVASVQTPDIKSASSMPLFNGWRYTLTNSFKMGMSKAPEPVAEEHKVR